MPICAVPACIVRPGCRTGSDWRTCCPRTPPSIRLCNQAASPTCFVITSGSLPPSPAELLAGPALSAFARAVRNEYDFVVFDAPPVLGLADSLLLSAHVDGVVFVTESLGTTRSMLHKSLNRLRSVSAPLVGLLLTKYVVRGNEEYYYSPDYSYGSANPDSNAVA